MSAQSLKTAASGRASRRCFAPRWPNTSGDWLQAHPPAGPRTALPMRFLLLVALSACSSTAPSHYGQGVPVRPPPAPPARPGVGAPVVGQPGAQAAPVPRSPNRRPLPPSAEPGLWSADSPRAASAPGGAPKVFGVDMPTLEDVPPSARVHEKACANTLARTLKTERVSTGLARLNEREKECVALAAYAACLRLAEDGTRGQRDAQRQGEVEGLGRLARHVDGLANHVCQSQPRSDNMLAAGTVVHLALAKTLVPWWRSP